MGKARTIRNVVLASALGCLGAFAQTTDLGIQAFTEEVMLPLNQIGYSGQINVPANVLASVQSGAVEIRQNVAYIPGARALRVRHYLVQKGAPNPTVEGSQMGIVEDYTVAIRDLIRTETPPTLTFVGTIDTVNSESPFGQSRGLPFIYSVMYDNATPTKFTNLVLLIPGRVNTFAQTTTGTLTLGTGTTNPGGGGLQANAGPDITTVASELTLDASNTTAPSNTTLTYQWRAVSGPANVLDPTSPRTRVQLAGNFGVYVFELTVTDQNGNTSTAQVRVQYTGRF